MTSHARKRVLSQRLCTHCDGRGWVQFKGWPKVCVACDGARFEEKVSIPVIPTYMARVKVDATTHQYFDPEHID